MKDWLDQFAFAGNFLGWAVNLIQLLIWTLGIVRKKNQLIEIRETEIRMLKEELADLKDFAEKCKQVATHAVSIIRERAPKVHKEFVEEYSEEEILPQWVLSPKFQQETGIT